MADMACLPTIDSFDTPWQSNSELSHVYTLIFGSTEGKREERILHDMIETKNSLLVWKMRCPEYQYILEIDVTLAFVIAYIHNTLNNKMMINEEYGCYLDESSLPPLYSSAIVKFGQLIRYYKKDGGRYCRTKRPPQIELTHLQHAESVGVPGWLAELRNETSHASMPSLNLLKHGTYIAMDWLRCNFWEPLIVYSKDNDHLSEVLKSYLETCQNEHLLLKLICGHPRRGINCGTVQTVTMAFVKATAPTHNQHILNFHFSQRNFDIVKPIILCLTQRHLLPAIVKILIQLLKSTEHAIKTSALAWLVEILRGLTTKSSSLSDVIMIQEAQNIQSSIPKQLKWIRILHQLALIPSKESLQLMKYLAIIIPSSKDMVEKVSLMMETFLGENIYIPTAEFGDQDKQKRGKRKRRHIPSTEWTAKTVDDVKEALKENLARNTH